MGLIFFSRRLVLQLLYVFAGFVIVFSIAPNAQSLTPLQNQGCIFNKEYAYKASNSSAVYFITEDCTKRAFTRGDIFFTYFDSWDRVEATSALALRMTPDDPFGFMPYGPLYDPQYGALVKIVKDPKVYLLLGDERYWITSEDVFNALGYQWDWIEDVDPRLLEKYTEGSEITDTTRHPNFTLVKYAGDSKVYRLEEVDGVQVKRYIVDEAAFRALRFRLDRIVTISAAETYPDGPPLTKADVQSPRSPGAREDRAVADCTSNPNPVFTHHLVEPSEVTEIIPPPSIDKNIGDLKTHSYVFTNRVGIPIYAPVDMTLIGGAHYLGGPYSLDFRVSCEVTLRLAHLDPVQAVKDFFPAEPAPLNDSRGQEVKNGLTLKAGDVVGYIYQDAGVLSTGVDFGVYHADRPNRYADSPDERIRRSNVYTTAVCPYEYFVNDIRSSYRSVFKLERADIDGSSFCE